ncbi:MAG: TVP38/TMEM64 family protein [Elusimicrobia bacterium]|nr:TVP38/TMEM64 family protein [Elusimicrobiota bacterium]
MKIKGALSFFAALMLIVAFKYFNVGSYMEIILARIQGLGPGSPVIFVVIYIAACVFFVPGSILTLGAGAIFGVVWGTIYVSVGSMLGATAAFLIGRYLARGWVDRKARQSPKFAAVSAAVAREGWKIVGLTRLSPIFPFNLLNYAFGITEVKLRDYVLASWVAMLPGTLMYVYIGSLAGSLANLGSGRHSRTSGEWALYVVGLIATVIVTVYITRIARSALEQGTGIGSNKNQKVKEEN